MAKEGPARLAAGPRSVNADSCISGANEPCGARAVYDNASVESTHRAAQRVIEPAACKGAGQVIHRIRCALCPSSPNQFLQRPIVVLFRMVGIASMDRIESAFIVTAMTSCLVLIGAAILTAFF